MLDVVSIADLSLQYPVVMGVINVTPHSFHNPLPNLDDAFNAAAEMIASGAQIIDVGAVATNPFVNLNSSVPSEQAEIDVLVPLIEKISAYWDGVISVDTSRAAVMRAAVAAGARMINDQRALSEENALAAAIALQVPVCLMHYFEPQRVPGSTSGPVLLAQIIKELQDHAERCISAGLSRDRIIVDPGFGGGHFGKNADENFYVLSQLESITALGYPVLVGLSRKMMLGGAAEDRLIASVAAGTIAAMKGAAIVRVHDVKETVEAMRMVNNVFSAS